ncbi:MAG: acyl-CoA dehydrogenase family protein [Bacteroidetes bacterium]|nr:acyl-CoA dehydrogenase family protein [Bacteroidota bacterium]
MMAVSNTSQYVISFTEEQNIIRESIKQFAETEIVPHILELDEKQEFPVDIMKKLGELGFLGILIPEKFCGAGLGYIEYAIIVEELAKYDPSISLSVAAHNGLCANHINVFGNDFQKEKYLKDLAQGKKIGAWALTEPGSGSDAAGMSTTADRDGDHFVLNGTKSFITHGGVGETAVIIAITNKENRKNGISSFVVEKGTPGFEVGKKENKLGMRASETTQLIFENCKVPAENLLGNEGEGFIQAMKILEGGRISIAALSLGLAEGCLENSLKYSKERIQFKKPISSFQGIQFKLSDMATDIEAAKMFTFKSAWEKDNSASSLNTAPMAKLFASEIATKAANEAVQIFGGYGFVKDYPVEKFYRDVKLLTIGEGTSEVQRIVIARNLLKSLG